MFVKNSKFNSLNPIIHSELTENSFFWRHRKHTASPLPKGTTQLKELRQSAFTVRNTRKVSVRTENSTELL